MYPWEQPDYRDAQRAARNALEATRSQLIKDPVTGLWPGQKHPEDIPDFLTRRGSPPTKDRS